MLRQCLYLSNGPKYDKEMKLLFSFVVHRATKVAIDTETVLFCNTSYLNAHIKQQRFYCLHKTKEKIT